jgi:hypothetical protein
MWRSRDGMRPALPADPLSRACNFGHLARLLGLQHSKKFDSYWGRPVGSWPLRRYVLRDDQSPPLDATKPQKDEAQTTEAQRAGTHSTTRSKVPVACETHSWSPKPHSGH